MEQQSPKWDEEQINDRPEDLPTEVPKETYRTKALKKRSLILFPLTYFGFVLAIGFVFGLIFTVSSIVINKDVMDTTTSMQNLAYVFLLLETLGFAIALLLFKSVRTFIFERFSFTPFKQKSTYVWLLLSIAIIYGSQFIVMGLLKIDAPVAEQQLFGITPDNFTIGKYILLLVGVAILTPIKEELLFRGYVLRFFESKYNKAWVGVLISSTIFGLLHLQYPVTGVIMGLIFAGLYLKFRTLTVPIVAHMIWNTIVCMMALNFFL